VNIFKQFFQKIISWDHALNTWVVKNEIKTVKGLFKIITCLGYGGFWFPIYLIIFMCGAEKVRGIVSSIIIAELLGYLIIIIIRNMLPRERPKGKSLLDKILPWNKCSFPSHHSLRALLLATVWGIGYPSTFALLICLAGLIGFSRIYLQRHYLSDVLTGSVLGIICGWFGLINL